MEVYDPATDQGGPLLAPIPTPRSAPGWGTYNGKIYVVGGEVRNAVTSATFRTIDAYDPRTNTWMTMPPMETARHGVAVDFIGNKLHVVSGNVQSGGGPAALVETEAHEVLEIPKK